MGQWFQRLRREEKYLAYLFILPSSIIITTFTIVPLITAFFLSLHEYNMLSAPKFVGMQNYADLLQDPIAHTSLVNSFKWTAMVLPAQTIISLGVALLLNQKIKGKKLFRTGFFIPYITSMIVVSIVWLNFYNSKGLINRIIVALGFPPQRFLSDVNLALPALALVSIWKFLPFYAFIFLAGLQQIPEELYEAAKMDGANTLQRFRHVTWPSLLPTTTFVIVFGTLSTFKVFDLVWVMTRGGPNYATSTMVLYIVETFYRHLKCGYASALSIFLLMIIFTMTFIQRKYLQRMMQ